MRILLGTCFAEHAGKCFLDKPQTLDMFTSSVAKHEGMRTAWKVHVVQIAWTQISERDGSVVKATLPLCQTRGDLLTHIWWGGLVCSALATRTSLQQNAR